jgi:hypothetical protein
MPLRPIAVEYFYIKLVAVFMGHFVIYSFFLTIKKRKSNSFSKTQIEGIEMP